MFINEKTNKENTFNKISNIKQLIKDEYSQKSISKYIYTFIF
jgi:hypothetical protein